MTSPAHLAVVHVLNDHDAPHPEHLATQILDALRDHGWRPPPTAEPIPPAGHRGGVVTQSPRFIAATDPEWCAGCGQKHSKCQCAPYDDRSAPVETERGGARRQQIATALRGAVYPVDIAGATDELVVVVERLERAAVAEALREAASEVMRAHGTASLAAKVLRARAIAVDAL